MSFSAAQLVIGFQDGVVRLLELYDPKGLTLFAGRKKILDAELHLKQVFKPHTAEVTALAYDRDGEILATGVSAELSLISYWNSTSSFPFESTYSIEPYLPKLIHIFPVQYV